MMMTEEWVPKKCHKCKSIDLILTEKVIEGVYYNQYPTGLFHTDKHGNSTGILDAECVNCGHIWRLKGTHSDFIFNGEELYLMSKEKNDDSIELVELFSRKPGEPYWDEGF